MFSYGIEVTHARVMKCQISLQKITPSCWSVFLPYLPTLFIVKSGDSVLSSAQTQTNQSIAFALIFVFFSLKRMSFSSLWCYLSFFLCIHEFMCKPLVTSTSTNTHNIQEKNIIVKNQLTHKQTLQNKQTKDVNLMLISFTTLSLVWVIKIYGRKTL